MTRKELSQLYYLNREIDKDKARLAELEAAATSTSPKITGLPHINSLSDKTAIAAEIADTKTIIESKVKRSLALYNQINRYISTIDDSFMRQIMTFRHAECMTWDEVAANMGGGNTENGIKSAYHRYINSKVATNETQ